MYRHKNLKKLVPEQWLDFFEENKEEILAPISDRIYRGRMLITKLHTSIFILAEIKGILKPGDNHVLLTNMSYYSKFPIDETKCQIKDLIGKCFNQQWLRARIIKSGDQNQIKSNLKFLDIPTNRMHWLIILRRPEILYLVINYYPIPFRKIPELRDYDIVVLDKFHIDKVKEDSKEVVEVIKKELPMPIWEEMFEHPGWFVPI